MSDTHTVAPVAPPPSEETELPGVWLRINTRSIIALMLVVSFIALVFLLAIRDPNGDVFKVLAGALSTVGFAGVVAWYFGSSKSSDDKNAALMGRTPPAS